MDKLSEIKDLARRLRMSDQQAFSELYEIYHGKLFRFTLSYLHSVTEAEDVVHDLFVKLWKKRKLIQPDQNFDSYLFTLSKNHILNLIRNKRVRRECRDEIRSSDVIPHNPTLQRISEAEYQHLYDQVLAQLPKRRKEVYLLSRQEGLTYKEIAAKLDISENTVEVHMVRALKCIRQSLLKKGDDHIRTLIQQQYS